MATDANIGLKSGFMIVWESCPDEKNESDDRKKKKAKYTVHLHTLSKAFQVEQFIGKKILSLNSFLSFCLNLYQPEMKIVRSGIFYIGLVSMVNSYSSTVSLLVGLRSNVVPSVVVCRAKA